MRRLAFRSLRSIRLLIAAGTAIGAAEATAGDLRAWDFGDFGRLIVDFGDTTNYELDVDGTQIVIRFSEPFPEDDLDHLATATEDLSRFVSEARFDAQGITLTLVATAPVRINDFSMNTGIAIDLWFESRMRRRRSSTLWKPLPIPVKDRQKSQPMPAKSSRRTASRPSLPHR